MDNGNLTSRLQDINNIPEKRVSVDELIRNLALSGNEKRLKLASELLELNLVQESKSEHLGPDCFDKISASQGNLSSNIGQEGSNNVEQAINTGNNSNEKESDMEWTTVKPKHKRNRSGSNDSEKIMLETSVSPNKKHKSGNGNVMKNGTNQVKSGRKAENYDRAPINKDSLLVIITEIPDSTYFNAIKMENMVLAAFPRLKESGMWTKYRLNKKHKNKCYITLPNTLRCREERYSVSDNFGNSPQIAAPRRSREIDQSMQRFYVGWFHVGWQGIGHQSDGVTQNAWLRCALCAAISGEISILIQTGAESWGRFHVTKNLPLGV